MSYTLIKVVLILSKNLIVLLFYCSKFWNRNSFQVFNILNITVWQRKCKKGKSEGSKYQQYQIYVSERIFFHHKIYLPSGYSLPCTKSVFPVSLFQPAQLFQSIVPAVRLKCSWEEIFRQVWAKKWRWPIDSKHPHSFTRPRAGPRWWALGNVHGGPIVGFWGVEWDVYSRGWTMGRFTTEGRNRDPRMRWWGRGSLDRGGEIVWGREGSSVRWERG